MRGQCLCDSIPKVLLELTFLQTGGQNEAALAAKERPTNNGSELGAPNLPVRREQQSPKGSTEERTV